MSSVVFLWPNPHMPSFPPGSNNMSVDGLIFARQGLVRLNILVLYLVYSMRNSLTAGRQGARWVSSTDILFVHVSFTVMLHSYCSLVHCIKYTLHAAIVWLVYDMIWYTGYRTIKGESGMYSNQPIYHRATRLSDSSSVFLPNKQEFCCLAPVAVYVRAWTSRKNSCSSAQLPTTRRNTYVLSVHTVLVPTDIKT